MSGFSNHLAQLFINYALRGQSVTQPPGRYLALFTADPTDANVTANEVSGGWYARQAITFQAPVTSGSNETTTVNASQITFSAVTTSAVTVTHWGIYDAATSGNLLASGAFTASKTLNVDDIFVVNAEALTVELV